MNVRRKVRSASGRLPSIGDEEGVPNLSIPRAAHCRGSATSSDLLTVMSSMDQDVGVAKQHVIFVDWTASEHS